MNENADAQKRAAIKASELLSTAAWFGLVAGAVEAVAFALLPRVADGFGFSFDPHSLWMTPVADALWFGALGVVLVAAARLLPRLVRPRLALFLFLFMGLTSLGYLVAPQINKKACMALAAGLAFQGSRMLDGRYDAFRRLVARTLPWMAAAVGLVACSIYGARAVRERYVVGRLASPKSGAPNVLLIVVDTVRAENMSLYGYARDTTPNLAKFAKTGVTFERAVTAAPWTLPSHANIFTGRQVHELSVDWKVPLDRTTPTLAEVLSSHGYATAGFAANHVYCARWSGLDRGFAHYDDFCVSAARIIASPRLFRDLLAPVRRKLGIYDENGRVDAPQVGDAFLNWLPRNDERPFFAFLNYFDAHNPYAAPAPYGTRFGHVRPKVPDVNLGGKRGVYGDGEIAPYVAQYDGAIARIDDSLGALFDELRARGVLEKTMVIVTADHGEEFVEHGVVEHAASLYMPSLHVPLVISLPSVVPAGRVVADCVAVGNVGATVLDLVGLDDEAGRFPGSSLAKHWTDAGASRSEPVLSELPRTRSWPRPEPSGKKSLQSVVMDGFHYIRNDGTTEELYQWDHDTWEARNLVELPEHRDVLERCRAELSRLVGK